MSRTWRDVLSEETVGERRHVCDLPGGEKVFRQGRSLILMMPDGDRVALSSAKRNGGYFIGPTAILNTTSITGPEEMDLMRKGHEEHMLYSIECSRMLGIDPGTSIGLGTGVTMDKAAIVTETSGGITVSAVITAGVEGNGGRAGDRASYNELEKHESMSGTIVVILMIDADLPPHSMARAIITATEAKTCVLQQLMAASKYSTGIASGSGTDQIAIVCHRGSPVKLTDAGKHSLLGEIIGRCVMKGLYQALENWAGLTPESQRNVLRRLARYKIDKEDFLRHKRMLTSTFDESRFWNNIEEMSSNGKLVSLAAAVIHIQDEIAWGLLDEAEGKLLGREMMIKTLPGLFGSDQHLDLDEGGDLIENLVDAMVRVEPSAY